ncbi:MAG: inositol monophosphatase family protein [Candidatus Micrarchaeia archaeon]
MDEKLDKFILKMLIDSDALLIKMQQGAQASNKAINDLVTDADIASQSLITSAILKKFPTHKIYTEEGAQNKQDLIAQNCWVIDPLDGTNNYAYGFPIWGVSIAYARNGKLIAGGLSFASQGIMLIAQKGKGAFKYELDKDGKISKTKINVSKRKKIEQAMALICFAARDKNADENFQKLARVSKQVFNSRNLGSAVYDIGFIAQGLAEVCVLFRLQPYDGAAGALIVREAGGKVTDMQGNEWKLDSPSMVATNGLVHERIIDLLSKKE